MKNIIFLTREFPLPGGRIGFTKDIIETLNKEFKFKIITFDMLPERSEKSSFKSREDYGAEVIKIKKKYKHHSLNLIYFFIQSHKLLKKLKKKNEVNLIIGTGLSGLGGILFAKTNKIPSIFNTSGIRGRNISEYIYYPTQHIKKKNRSLSKLKNYPRFLLTYLADHLCLLLADCITIPTEYLKEQMQKNKPKLYKKIKNKLKVIIEGLNIDKIEKNLDKEKLLKEYNIDSKKVILFSRIEDKTFSEGLFKSIRKEIPEATIISVDVTRTTMRIDKGEGLEYTNMGPIKAMLMSDVMFCIPGTEPHSTIVLEALYNNCPTFVSNVGWLRYEFKDFPQFIIKELKIEKIVETIKEFYTSQEEFKKKSKELRKKVLEKNDFDKTIEEYKRLFLKLTS